MELYSNSASLASVEIVTSLMSFCFPTHPEVPLNRSEPSPAHDTPDPSSCLPSISHQLHRDHFPTPATLNSLTKQTWCYPFNGNILPPLTTGQTSIHSPTLPSLMCPSVWMTPTSGPHTGWTQLTFILTPYAALIGLQLPFLLEHELLYFIFLYSQ